MINEIPGTTIFESEYPYFLRPRPYEISIGGKKIKSYLDRRARAYRSLVQQSKAFIPDLTKLCVEGSHDETVPFWDNKMLPVMDGVVLYTLIRTKKPRTYLEVGSGNSTKFVRQAIIDGNLKTKIVSIDPHPRASIDTICDQIVREPFESLGDMGIFSNLLDGDIVFIDNSHRSFPNSDVTVFFTETLPALAPGVIYGIHDIFLPQDYPQDFCDRFYNEQYLLASYILGGADGDTPLFPATYGTLHALSQSELILEELGLKGWPSHVGAFWMQRSRKIFGGFSGWPKAWPAFLR